VRRLVTAVLATTLLILTTACDPGSVPSGTVTSKGHIRNASNNTDCWWIKVRHDDGTNTQGCIPIAKWNKVRKGDHWTGS
jgi:hypothetical protein